MTTATPNPLRTLGAFLASKARLLTAAKDEGGLFEIRFMGRLLGRGQSAVTTAATNAATAHEEATALRDFVLRETSDDDDTPREIDSRERRQLLKLLGTHTHTTRHHAGELEHLA
jgi:hypothetical protein